MKEQAYNNEICIGHFFYEWKLPFQIIFQNDIIFDIPEKQDPGP